MPTLVNIDAAHDIILLDRRKGLKKISEELDTSYVCAHHIYYIDFDLRKISAK